MYGEVKKNGRGQRCMEKDETPVFLKEEY